MADSPCEAPRAGPEHSWAFAGERVHVWDRGLCVLRPTFGDSTIARSHTEGGSNAHTGCELRDRGSPVPRYRRYGPSDPAALHSARSAQPPTWPRAHGRDPVALDAPRRSELTSRVACRRASASLGSHTTQGWHRRHVTRGKPVVGLRTSPDAVDPLR